MARYPWTPDWALRHRGCSLGPLLRLRPPALAGSPCEEEQAGRNDAHRDVGEEHRTGRGEAQVGDLQSRGREVEHDEDHDDQPEGWDVGQSGGSEREEGDRQLCGGEEVGEEEAVRVDGDTHGRRDRRGQHRRAPRRRRASRHRGRGTAPAGSRPFVPQACRPEPDECSSVPTDDHHESSSRWRTAAPPAPVRGRMPQRRRTARR